MNDQTPVDVTQENLTAFVRAGGVVSLAEWVALDFDTQVALARAGTAVRAEFALAVAAALAGGAAEVARAIDGGEAADEMRLDALLNRGLRGRVANG